MGLAEVDLAEGGWVVGEARVGLGLAEEDWEAGGWAVAVD